MERIPNGNNTFSLINRATGVVLAERLGHNNATSHVRALEAKEAQFGIKQFGQPLRSWAIRISAILAVFAFLGSHL
ncbi:hypothetical protein VSQ82_08680 [Pseudomonas sp. MS-1(2024)]|uniref:hypothetical protein n=1 Tax=Pseudomonas sp. MS-1(2024) TaxID=3112251 RepID=UPI002DB7BC6A|nr:hypothetical protein [Pseudomonas sp. MS-1(2024)]MEC4167318.1 hypothetical protein [Pseudomonas sp. MS-1(2024)]